MSHWTDPFIALPYLDFGRSRAGVDCWGLVTVVFQDMAGISLPSYAGQYVSVEEHCEIDGLISAAKDSQVWKRVDGMARPLDIAVFRRGRLDAHVGVVVSDGLMLHMVGNDQSKIEHYNNGRWAPRLTGIYRHINAPLRIV